MEVFQLSLNSSNKKQSDWMVETISSELVIAHGIKEVLYSTKSEFQDINIVNLGSFGKCLVLDGHVQSSEVDEFLYHESLIHPTMILHPNPQKIFIAGGGEGATAREILRHKTVKSVVMVDIDSKVIDVSKEKLSHHHDGAFEDPRLTVIVDDAKVHLEKTTETYDVIVMDLPDPVEEGPCYLLYTQNFYKMLRTRLNPGGLLVTQSGPASLTTLHESFSPIHKTLSTVFDAVYPYTCYVPSFGDHNGFNLASLGPSPLTITDEEIDKRIEERIKDGSKTLKLYDSTTHRNFFSQPKPIRQFLAKETTVITEDHPSFCFKAHS